MRKIIFILLLLVPVIADGQVITTFAGTGSAVFSGDGSAASVAGISNPGCIVFDKFSNSYVASGMDNRIRKISSTGIISTFAGTGSGTFGGDGGAATLAKLYLPQAVRLDTFGHIYIADAGNHRIRKIDITTGIISTVAGNGTGAFSGDGMPATAASIYNPQDICFDKFGNMYIADYFNFRIRKVNTLGIMSTFAGNGTPGSTGDGAPATAAEINVPMGLAADDTGNIYIAELSGGRIRKVNTLGIISTIAGNGPGSYSGEGGPAITAIMTPLKVFVDSLGQIFIADKSNHRVYKVNTSGIISTIAGNGTPGDGGDGGPASAALLSYPTGVAFDPCGNLYMPTVGNVSLPGQGRRIRKVTYNPTCDPTLNINNTSAQPPITTYPNPASSLIHIDNIKPNTTYQLLSIVGAVMQSGDLKEGSNTISIQHLAPGMYLLHLTDVAGERVVTKIIKR